MIIPSFQPPSADAQPFFSDRLPAGLFRIYVGFRNSPRYWASLLLCLLIIAINFLDDVGSTHLNSGAPLFFMGLIAIGLGFTIQRDLQGRNGDLHRLSSVSGTSLVWGHWLAGILPLLGVGALVLFVDNVRLFLVPLINPTQSAPLDALPPPQDLLDVLSFTSTSTNIALYFSFLCLTSLTIAFMGLFAKSSKIGLVILLISFLLGLEEMLDPVETWKEYYFSEAKPLSEIFTRSEVLLAYVLMNGLMLLGSVLMLMLSRCHYDPVPQWGLMKWRMLSLLPLAAVAFVATKGWLPQALAEPMWWFSGAFAILFVLAQLLFFAPRAGRGAELKARLWLLALFFLMLLATQLLFPLGREANGARDFEFVRQFLIAIGPLSVLGLFFGSKNPKLPQFYAFGLIAAILLIPHKFGVDAEPLLCLSIGATMLFWQGGLLACFKVSTSPANAPQRLEKAKGSLGDWLPADFVKGLRQCLKNPVFIIFLIVGLFGIYLSYAVGDNRAALVSRIAWFAGAVSVAFFTSSLNRDVMKGKGNNFFLLLPSGAMRIVLNQWLSGMAAIGLLTLCLAPLWGLEGWQGVMELVLALSMVGFFLAFMMLIAPWHTLLRVLAVLPMWWIAVLLQAMKSADKMEDTILLQCVILSLVATYNCLLMTRRYYQSSNAHDMLPVRLISLLSLLVPLVLMPSSQLELMMAFILAFLVLLLDCLLPRDPRRSLWRGAAQYLHGQGSLSNATVMILWVLCVLPIYAMAQGLEMGLAQLLLYGAMLSLFVAPLLLLELSLAPSSTKRALCFALYFVGSVMLIGLFTDASVEAASITPFGGVSYASEVVSKLKLGGVPESWSLAYNYLFVAGILWTLLIFICVRNQKTYLYDR